MEACHSVDAARWNEPRVSNGCTGSGSTSCVALLDGEGCAAVDMLSERTWRKPRGSRPSSLKVSAKGVGKGREAHSSFMPDIVSSLQLLPLFQSDSPCIRRSLAAASFGQLSWLCTGFATTAAHLQLSLALLRGRVKSSHCRGQAKGVSFARRRHRAASSRPTAHSQSLRKSFPEGVLGMAGMNSQAPRCL